jgi:hypothetical protein
MPVTVTREDPGVAGRRVPNEPETDVDFIDFLEPSWDHDPHEPMRITWALEPEPEHHDLDAPPLPDAPALPDPYRDIADARKLDPR